MRGDIAGRRMTITSFGYKNGAPAEKPGVVIIDVRAMFLNPHHNPALRKLTGKDNAVKAYVMRTPNFNALYDHLVHCASVPGVDEVHIGCVGGRHRSVAIAEMLGARLVVEVRHRDLK